MFSPPDMPPIVVTEFKCPLGYVAKNGIVDTKFGDCGYRRCYPSSCARLEMLKTK